MSTRALVDPTLLPGLDFRPRFALAPEALRPGLHPPSTPRLHSGRARAGVPTARPIHSGACHGFDFNACTPPAKASNRASVAALRRAFG